MSYRPLKVGKPNVAEIIDEIRIESAASFTLVRFDEETDVLHIRPVPFVDKLLIKSAAKRHGWTVEFE